MLTKNHDPVTVSELVHALKGCLEENFAQVMVEGEVSNFSLNSSGHSYFTLSDAESSLSCAVFKMDVMRNPIMRTLKNGEKIILMGEVGIYAKRGSLQVIGKKVFHAGKGNLAMQYEMLKEKLRKEGFFEPEHKKPIPEYPKRIAVITALQGAALQDFLNIMKRRCFSYSILIVPALVQGDEAPKSLIQALKRVQKLVDIELIVFARGGGSQEDLWAFNSELLVREIFACPIPVISAVGHQVDYTLCDFVADLRVETPSAAAEIISSHQKEIKNTFSLLYHQFIRHFMVIQQEISKRVEKVNPAHMLKLLWEKLHSYQKDLAHLDLRHRLVEFTRIHEYYQTLDDLEVRMKSTLERKMTSDKNRLLNIENSLQALSPQLVLKRGYSYVSHNGKMVKNRKDFEKVPSGTKMELTFSDGSGVVRKET